MDEGRDSARVQRRSNAMTGFGGVGLAWGLIAAFGFGSPAGLLIALIGAVLLVGGLVIRR